MSLSKRAGKTDKRREIRSKPWREGLCDGGVEVGKLYVTRIVIRPKLCD